MTMTTGRVRLYGYAMVIIIIASCGHERPFAHSRRFLGISHNEQNKVGDIPWVPSQSSTKDQHLFADLPDFMSGNDEQQMDGASQNNIRSEREIWANIVASMPYAMPFYCDPACYEPSIILALQDCQPYIFALFYFYQNPPRHLYVDDDRPDRPVEGRSFAPKRRRGYCQGR